MGIPENMDAIVAVLAGWRTVIYEVDLKTEI
jgi:hypothetical protein